MSTEEETPDQEKQPGPVGPSEGTEGEPEVTPPAEEPAEEAAEEEEPEQA
jgi:hypothetical protein